MERSVFRSQISRDFAHTVDRECDGSVLCSAAQRPRNNNWILYQGHCGTCCGRYAIAGSENGRAQSASRDKRGTERLMQMRSVVIRVPANSEVFILEDSGTRLQWFFERLNTLSVQYSSSVEDALSKLTHLDREAFVFLDHDLCWRDAAGHKPGSGVRVAHFLAKSGFAGRIVIHSVNEEGAMEMKRWLPKAELHPFGTFEIEIASQKSRSTSA
jgi:hypothetical protein